MYEDEYHASRVICLLSLLLLVLRTSKYSSVDLQREEWRGPIVSLSLPKPVVHFIRTHATIFFSPRLRVRQLPLTTHPRRSFICAFHSLFTTIVAVLTPFHVYSDYPYCQLTVHCLLLPPPPWISFSSYSIPIWQIIATQKQSLPRELQSSHKASSGPPRPPSPASERAQHLLPSTPISLRQPTSRWNHRNMLTKAPGPETPPTDRL